VFDAYGTLFDLASAVRDAEVCFSTEAGPPSIVEPSL
jgi:FMN phosphatase YigB (HAD superfamily)